MSLRQCYIRIGGSLIGRKSPEIKRRWLSSNIQTLWCENIVFSSKDIHDNNDGIADSSLLLEKGSIDIDEMTGVIIACRPGEDWATAKDKKGSRNLGQFVLSPGMIDVHTHISALGRNWEGYTTATMAAAAGGITTIMGMPLNSIPSTTTLNAIEMERAQASNESLFVDVGLWGGVIPENLEHINSILESPYIFGLKAFLAPLPPAAGYEALSPDQLIEAAKICGPTGKPILVHSELMTYKESNDMVESAFADTNHTSYQAHLKSRPSKWEQDAVKVVCKAIHPDPLDSSQHCRMHIVHLSDARGCLPIINAHKKNFSSKSLLTVETCPQYLLLDDSQISDGDTRIKCFPPIRDKENREELWQALSNNLIDMVASDHSPCEPYMRKMDTGNIKEAWGGLSSLQYQLQATWTEAFHRNISPIEMSRWWSQNPAKLVGLSHIKGRISEGYQADLCLWDPNHIGAPNEYSKEHHRWKGTTYFADNPLMRGRVLGTWIKGKQIYDGINDQHSPPHGNLLTTK